VSYKVAAQLGVDGEELLDFFLTFSRFEFALKTTGFFRPRHQRRRQRNEPDEYPDAEPDWNAFATSIEGSFRPDADPDLETACTYILQHPPDREVVANSNLMWETRGPAEGLPEITRLLLAVRWVRNNLFHGAKFSPVHGDAERNRKLIKSSLVILKGCLAVSSKVREEYKDAAL
jgi:hypothetical protein